MKMNFDERNFDENGLQEGMILKIRFVWGLIHSAIIFPLVFKAENGKGKGKNVPYPCVALKWEVGIIT